MKPLCILLVALAFPAGAQDVRFSSDVNVVSLLATVRDRDGAIVKNLTRDDFRLEDDGRRQTIRYFSQESDLPLVIALLVDTSRSMQPVFVPERAAALARLRIPRLPSTLLYDAADATASTSPSVPAPHASRP